MVDQQCLHEEAYRWEVVAALMRDHSGAILQYCLTWLGERAPKRAQGLLIPEPSPSRGIGGTARA